HLPQVVPSNGRPLAGRLSTGRGAGDRHRAPAGRPGYPPRMREQFTGWPEQAMDVLWQLQGEPTKETRERCRADRERLVRQPMIALLNGVADADPRYEDFSVWHYRTGSWWWQHQSAVIRLGRKVEINLRFSL